MKVAISFPGCHRRAGVERIVFECARFLAGRQHEVTVYANEWEPDPTQPQIRYVRVPTRKTIPFLAGYSYFLNSTRLIGRARYDVLNTHGCICPFGGVMWVQSIQKAWLETSRRFRAPFSWPRIRQRLNPLHPVLLHLENKHFRERRYRKLIGTTPTIRKELHRLYGVPPEDVEIIPNGFSEEEFNPARRESLREKAREELGLRPDNVVLLFAANELMRKGYKTLLRALQMLGAPEMRVLVVGRADRAEAIHGAAVAGLSDQIIVCGPSQDIGRYHAAADVFVLPTQYEAFSLAILEALGSGLPVVTTRVPGAQDAIRPGVNGELVEPDAAEELCECLRRFRDPDTRQRYTAQASQSVREYRWSEILQRYEKLLFQESSKN